MVLFAPGNPQPLDGHVSHNHNTGMIGPFSVVMHPHYSTFLLVSNISGTNFYKNCHHENKRVLMVNMHIGVASYILEFVVVAQL